MPSRSTGASVVVLNVGTPTGIPLLTVELVIVVVIVYWIFLPDTGAQSVAVYPLPEFGAAGLQVVTTVGALLTVLQVVSRHEGAAAVTGVQELTSTGPVAVTGQVVVVQLGEVSPEATHVPACTGMLVATTGHVTVVQLGAEPTLGVQVPAATAALELFDVQVVPVQELPLLAGVVMHVCTGALVVLLGVQGVVTQLGPTAGPDAMQVPD